MMSKFTIPTVLALSLAASSAWGQSMQILPNGSRPSASGPASNFTGSAVVTPLFSASPPTRATGGQVTFAPSARSNWHTHPAGQILIVTSGVGWVQEWNGEKQQIKPGDVVWTPPGVKHWHGASATTGLTHIAIQENVDGRNVDWLEPVTDDQYRR
ncbi:cupin domain-containing protein [Caulobacter sp. SSI4214]|uniref:(R)-mandelonitrile lyase n=1 Tax=Caulobacter sp. SSI4214 TaxID=2575739 RepID=UPI001F5141B5|nr:cupin domain-containing protein [Caulobacter sp. SSI4214]